jgi:tRNA-Thr(GGU) m(6)t(6)A37 methyltransferase TsaA
VELAAAPRQPAAARGVRGTIELLSGRGFEHALEGVASWSHLWVIFWFHHAEGATVRKVRPPRSAEKVGVFATRSPHRPNPIGLSLVRLVGLRDLVLEVEDLDLVDGTPVLDLKPYVPYADVADGATSGWLPAPADPGPRWAVSFTEEASAQLAWIEAHGEPGLGARLARALSLGPAPHPYRRIRAEAGGVRTIALKAWRAVFRVDGDAVLVERIATGHRPRDLAVGEGEELDRHRAFTVAFARGAS